MPFPLERFPFDSKTTFSGKLRIFFYRLFILICCLITFWFLFLLSSQATTSATVFNLPIVCSAGLIRLEANGDRVEFLGRRCFPIESGDGFEPIKGSKMLPLGQYWVINIIIRQNNDIVMPMNKNLLKKCPGQPLFETYPPIIGR